jgi:hypothetical protein
MITTGVPAGSRRSYFNESKPVITSSIQAVYRTQTVLSLELLQTSSHPSAIYIYRVFHDFRA